MLKKLCNVALASFMTLSCFQSPFMVKAIAKSGIIAEIKGDKVTIGNEYISRELSTKGKKLTTTKITNKRTDTKNTVFAPAAGSEEFKIRTTKNGENDEKPIVLEAINRSGWTAIADSYQNKDDKAGDGPASNLIDNDINSIWHSKYNNNGTGEGKFDLPHSVVFNLGKETEFQSFSYTPRQEGVNTNGNIKGYELWIANTNSKDTLPFDSSEWKKVKDGEMKYETVDPYYVNIGKKVKATQVKFVAKTAQNGNKFAGGAEFNLHKDVAPVVDPNKKLQREFYASDLKLKGNPVISDTSAKVNNVDKTGKKITFNFEPYTFKDVTYTISENFVMYEGDHFMRKFLEITVPETQADKAEIDYIDLESLKVNKDDTTWTIPTDQGGIVQMDRFKANLGQPIYIDGMFLGCEFPATDTEIVDKTGFMRYYTGKTFSRLAKDKQAEKSNGKVHYQTWQTVAGAARSTELQVVQADFFEYINSISTPSNFRLQYNSWFDNMMRIDDNNILNSFIEMDREFNKAETRPMDSYVVDDGWNNYNPTEVSVDTVRSGTGKNKSGFWEFNSKFPKGLTPSSELVHNFGSNFGVWVGPRGGYNFQNHLANIVTTHGKGSSAGGSVDVADREYIKNFQEMAIEWQDKYDVNYWKWDGFADTAQYGAFKAENGVAKYNEEHRHMTGGYNHMYHVTDLWEAWISLMEAVRANADANPDIKMPWISLTCYVNPSPWFLQWANSVWIQCIHDQSDASFGKTKMNKQMTYRDSVYYDFIKNHQFQFPLSNIYNHDPIYGKEGTHMNINTASDEEFKNYLYMLATRGTAFWELYFSDSLMTDGKYEVVGEFTRWAEENYHILKNAKMIGGAPDSIRLSNATSGLIDPSAYGFACFDGTDGIISMRNPSATEKKTIEFVFDRTIGVSETAKGKTIYRSTEHLYDSPFGADEAYKTLKYGQKVSVELQPGEVRIWNLSATKDTKAPSIVRTFTDGNRTIGVRFDEKVDGKLFTVDGKKIQKIKKAADDITYYITLSEELTDGEKVNVTAKGIKDKSGNLVANPKVVIQYNKNNVVIEQNSNKETSINKALNTDYGFTVSAKGEISNNKVFAQQDYKLGVDSNNKAYFELNGAKAISNKALEAGNHTITGVKENNGILKLYVDGKLTGSSYKKENRYYKVTGTSTSVATDTELKVFDTAYGYNEVEKLCQEKPDVPTKTPIDSKNFVVTVSNTSETNSGTTSAWTEADKNKIFDKDNTTFWTSGEVEHVNNGEAWLKVDLGANYKLNQIDYTPRYYNNAANYWKCSGNIKKLVVEISQDGNTWIPVTKDGGEDLSNKINNVNDKTYFPHMVEFAEQEARFIRIKGNESYHHAKPNKYITVADLAIYGEKVSYDNIAKGKPSSAKWVKDDSNAALNSQRPASMGNDGIVPNNTADSNYVDFGQDNKNEASYYEIDLEKLSEVNSIKLYRYWNNNRQYGNTVIALSETKDFTKPVIVYNSDADNVFGFGEGKDKKYPETKDGHEFVLETPVNARYVRVYMNGHSGGTTNHIVELMVYGKQKEEIVDVVDVTPLVNRLDEINSKINENDYTIDSLKSFNEKMNKANALLETAKTQEEITNMINELSDIEKGLVRRGDITELEKLVNENINRDKNDYKVSEEQWNAFVEALNNAQSIVEDNSNKTQADVDAAKTSLENAISTLKYKDADYSKVNEAIEKANKLNKDDYQNFDEVEKAIANVKQGLDITKQKEVDAMAKAIEDAIINLIKKPDPDKPVNPDGNKPVNPDGNKPVDPDGNKPVDPDGNKPVNPDGNKPVEPAKPVVPTKPEQPTKPNNEKVENEESLNTGVSTNTALLWTVVLGAGVVAALLVNKKRKAHR